MSQSPEYKVWTGILKRCLNRKAKAFKNYGGRGISVCKEWRKDFARFYADIGPRPSNDHTIERIDNDGHYEPSNCQWIERAKQPRNRRNVRMFAYQGGTVTVPELSQMTGMKYGTLHQRLYDMGLTVEEAINRPLRKSRWDALRS